MTHEPGYGILWHKTMTVAETTEQSSARSASSGLGQLAMLSSIEHFLSPIPGASPCGEDQRHHPDYLITESEAKKLGGMRDEDPDWEQILEKSTELLQSSTKDLKLAGCYTLASLHTRGVRGAVEGLTLVVALLEAFWDGVHPLPRTPTNFKRRASPLTWLNNHLKKLLGQSTDAASDAQSILELQKVLQRYKEVCLQGFERQAPAIGDLLAVVDGLAKSCDPTMSIDESEISAKTATPQDTQVSPAPAEPAPAPQAPTPSPVQQSESNADPIEESYAQLLSAVETLLDPIPGDRPGGEDERYDPAYLAASQEAQKLNNPLKDQSPDWELLVDNSTELLKTKTKDLHLAGYLALARYESGGLKGLAEGLVLALELLERFWEELYPRPRTPTNFKRRASPLSWLNKLIGKRLDLHTPQSDEATTIESLELVLLRYADTCNRQFRHEAPATRDLIAKTNALAIRFQEAFAPAPESPKAETPEPSAQEPTPAPIEANQSEQATAPPRALDLDTPAVEEAPLNLEQATEYLSSVGDTLQNLALQIFQANSKSAMAYRLHRQALWMHLEAPPPCVAGNKTGIPPLPTDARKQLETLSTHQNWAPLLEEAESRLGKFRFCLDLHRYVVIALQGLGQAQDAINAVKAELAALLTRMPTLVELQFSNGEGLASAETLDWIEREVLSSTGSRGSSQAEDNLEWIADLDGAVKAADPKAIIAAMQEALDQSRDRIQYAKRALYGTQHLKAVPGLPLLLAQLAHDKLRIPGTSESLHRELEGQALRAVLVLQTSLPAKGVPVLEKPQLTDLAIKLGRCSLEDALPYFTMRG